MLIKWFSRMIQSIRNSEKISRIEISSRLKVSRAWKPQIMKNKGKLGLKFGKLKDQSKKTPRKKKTKGIKKSKKRLIG
jgi:hypothetical protein